MESLLKIFSTRELAVITWLLVGFAWSLFYRGIRESYWGILKAFFATKVTFLALTMISYMAGLILFLWSLGLWYPSLLKDTVFWFVLTAFIPLIHLSKVRDDQHYFRKAVKEIFTFTIFTEFTLNYFTFSLLTELIVVPVLGMIAAMLAFSSVKPGNAKVNGCLKKLLKWISVALLLYVGFQLTVHWRSFFTWDTLTSLSLSPLLSLLYLPFVYALSVYIEYEQAFILLARTMPPELLPYAKRQALTKWRANKKALNRWIQRLLRKPVETRADITLSIADLKAQLSIERHPPEVNRDYGWSPYTAKNFMSALEISTRDYENYYMDEWTATSIHFFPDKKNHFDHFTFGIEGDRYIANKLWLLFSSWSDPTDVKHHQLFASFCASLFKQALNQEMPAEFHVAILLAKPKKRRLRGAEISIGVHAYHNNEKWQDVTFTIEKVAAARAS